MLPLLGRQGSQVVDGGVEVAGCPEHGGIEDQAERPELVLLPRSVCPA
jgi:hypothetical protein